MIHFIGAADGLAAVRQYLAVGRGGHDVAIYPAIAALRYRDILARGAIPPGGPAVFTEMGVLNGPGIARLCGLIRDLPATAAVLNHPLTSSRRYELLRVLHEAGLNRHNVYRAVEHRRPAAWPVFVRSDRSHWISPLLHDAHELKATLDGLVREGVWLGDMLVVEFNDYRSPDGLYRKYSAFRIGDRIFGAHLIAGHPWYLRLISEDAPDMYDDPRRLAHELDHVRAMEHADQVRRVFDLARLQYGRLDYAVVDGRVQTFEINTAPTILNPAWFSPAQAGRRETVTLVGERLAEAFAEIDGRGAGGAGQA